MLLRIEDNASLRIRKAELDCSRADWFRVFRGPEHENRDAPAGVDSILRLHRPPESGERKRPQAVQVDVRGAATNSRSIFQFES